MEYCSIDKEKVEGSSRNNVINLILRTVSESKKQVLVFNRSKSTAERTAEDVAKCREDVENKHELENLSKQVLNSLANPTSQCLRLANLVKKGVAFHHSGLVAKQREIIEENFRKGLIKVISSTPTLAAGINLPAYKVIIKDYKRYSPRGMANIPILEYHQMTGRAGRPGMEKVGKAILCVSDENEEQQLVKNYIYGYPEEIVSKLAVEPILKMYQLSLISMGLISTKKEIERFFLNSFYAYQYKDREAFKANLYKALDSLKYYNFVMEDDEIYSATPVGRKINELYLNPDTGHLFLSYFGDLSRKTGGSSPEIFSLVSFLCSTLEMRPLFKVYKREYDEIYQIAEKYIDDVLPPFDPYETEISDFLNVVKTTQVLMEWINETTEERIHEKYNVTPGELSYKINVVDWLLYSLEELAHMKKSLYFKNYLNKLRKRFKYGVREELISLVSVRNIGRVKARKLYENNIRSERDIEKSKVEVLSRLVGEKTAKNIKKLEPGQVEREKKRRRVSKEKGADAAGSLAGSGSGESGSGQGGKGEEGEEKRDLLDYF